MSRQGQCPTRALLLHPLRNLQWPGPSASCLAATGIIEGVHEGKGIGQRFLKHIERNASLLFLIPCETKDIIEEYKILLNELKKFNPELFDKKRILNQQSRFNG